MIEEKNLAIGIVCLYSNRQISSYAGFIVENQKENSYLVKYKVLNDEDWLVFYFCKKEAVIDGLNEELRNWGADITVTDYELDEEAGYIQFKIA